MSSTRKKLSCKTYDEMLEYILSQIQDRLSTSIDDLIKAGINPNLLNRIDRIARICYDDLDISWYSYDDMFELLGDDFESIAQFENNKNSMLFTFLKPTVGMIKTEFGDTLSISMAIDYKYVD